MAERGNYFFAGHLVVPNAVTLQGMWKSVPSHLGFRNQNRAKPTDEGTTFLVTENEGKENGEPFIRLNDNSTLSRIKGSPFSFPSFSVTRKRRERKWRTLYPAQ